jgi:plastocyanin
MTFSLDSRLVAVYYVIGIALVLWALALTALGVTRPGFPPTRQGGRALMAVSGVLVAGTLIAVIASTEREHPREEAKAEAAERAEAREQLAPGGRAGGQEAGEKQAEGGIVPVVEDEYSVKLPGGSALGAGPYAFNVVNRGKIEHDLAVEGAGVDEKTPLIKGGDSAKLEVQLETGRYKLYCTVPGHEELGMKTDLTVR